MQRFPCWAQSVLINMKWFAWMPTMQTRIYGGSRFCNARVCGVIFIIANTINLFDTHRKSPAIHHWLQEEMLTNHEKAVSFISNMFCNRHKDVCKQSYCLLWRYLSLTYCNYWPSIKSIITHLWVFWAINSIDKLLLIFWKPISWGYK